MIRTKGVLLYFFRHIHVSIFLFTIFFVCSPSIVHAAQSTSGTYLSQIKDAGAAAQFGTITWNDTTPAGTSITMEVRAGNNADLSDGVWTTVTKGYSLDTNFDGRRYYQYRITFATNDGNNVPSVQDVSIEWNNQTVSGSVISSPYDTADTANVLAGISWSATTPSGTSVTFQARTSGDGNTWTDWLGPDGTTGTSFTDSSGGQSVTGDIGDGSGDRYIQYKTTLASDGANTPTLSSATLTYVVNAPPEVEITTSTIALSSTGTVTIPYHVRDIDTNTGATAGSVIIGLEYCTANCSSSGNETWESAASSTLTGDYGSGITVQTGDQTEYTDYTVVWDAKTAYPNIYNGTDFKIRLVANDSEAVNNYGYGESNVFVFDTTDPLISMIIDARPDTDTTNLAITGTDDTTSGLEMKLSNNADLSADGRNASSGIWIAYTDTMTWDLGLRTGENNGTTVYYELRDIYGNVSNNNTTASASTPEIPGNMFIKDVSSDGVWREFLAWSVIDDPTPGFTEYTIYRSTDGETYTELSTQTTRTVNYYMDTDVETGTTYYYKVTATDVDGNISNYSSIVSDDPNGQGGTDVSAPTISNITTSTPTPDGITISWDTDEISDSTIDYTTTEDSDFTSPDGSITIPSYKNTAESLGRHEVVLTGLDPGTDYYFRIQSTDPDDNTGYTTSTEDDLPLMFTTLSGPTIENVTVYSIKNTQTTITWTTTDSADSYVTYSPTSAFTTATTTGQDESTTDHSVTLTDLTPNTTYYFYVSSDTATNKNTVDGVNQYYTVKTTADLTAPTITFNPSTNVAASDTSISISFTTDEPTTSTLEYGTSVSYTTTTVETDLNTTHSYTVTDLLKGTAYYFRIYASDQNNNRSVATTFSATTTDTTDYTPPVITNVTTTVITDTKAVITWDTDEASNGTVYYGTTSSTLTNTANQTAYNRSHSITLDPLTTSTLYYYKVVSADQSGNTSTSTIFSFTTLETLTEESEVALREEQARQEGISQGQSQQTSSGGGGGVIIIDNSKPSDTTPPTISNVTVTNITGSSATVSWSTDEAGDSAVEFSDRAALYDRAGVRWERETSHSITLTNLLPITTYYYRVSSADSAGNRSSYTTGTFKTELTDSIDTLYDSVDEASSPQAAEELFVASLERATQILKTMSSQVSLSVLESTLLDQSNIIRDLSKILPAPIIGGEPSLDVGSTYATIKWTTDKPSTSLVSYAPSDLYSATATGTAAYDQTVGQPDETETNHVVSIKGLRPNTLYHYQVISKTQTGTKSTSRDFTFRTKAETSEITSYSIDNITEGKATISWTTNVPTDSVILYTPYNTGTLATNEQRIIRDPAYVTEHTLIIPDLEVGLAYDVTLSGTDYGNNIVEKTIKGFTTEGTDVAPVISQIKTEASILPGSKQQIQVIISWNTNELSTSRVYYRKGFAKEGTEFTESTNLDSSYTNKHIMVVTNFDPGTVYQFQVESTDGGGNTGRSKTITLLTPRKEQSVFQVIMSNVEEMFSWVGKVR